jgi:hypothetical protein
MLANLRVFSGAIVAGWLLALSPVGRVGKARGSQPRSSGNTGE